MNTKRLTVLCPSFIILHLKWITVVMLIGVLLCCSSPEKQAYKNALKLSEAGKLDEALQVLDGIQTSDSALNSKIDYQRNQIHQQIFQKAVLLKNEGSYMEALQTLERIVTDDEDLQSRVEDLKPEIERTGFEKVRYSAMLVDLMDFAMYYPTGPHTEEVKKLIQEKTIEQMQDHITVKHVEGGNQHITIKEGDTIIIHQPLPSVSSADIDKAGNVDIGNVKAPNFVELQLQSYGGGKESQNTSFAILILTTASINPLPESGTYQLSANLNLYDSEDKLVKSIAVQYELAVEEHMSGGLEEVVLDVNILSELRKQALAKRDEVLAWTKKRKEIIENFSKITFEQVRKSGRLSVLRLSQYRARELHAEAMAVKRKENEALNELNIMVMKARTCYIHILLAKTKMAPGILQKYDRYTQGLDIEEIVTLHEKTEETIDQMIEGAK